MTGEKQAAGRGTASTYAAIIAIGLAIFLTVTFLPGGESATMAERFAHMDTAFSGIPDWVKRWMTFQHYVFAGSLLFVAWHVEARAYLLGLIVSHAISYGEIVYAPVDRLGLGLVSLNHLAWIPVLVLLIRRYPKIDRRSPFGLWYHLALFQLCFSLFFDIRDSARFLMAML